MDQKRSALTRNNHRRSRMGVGHRSNCLDHSMCGPTDKSGEDWTAVGDRSGSNRTYLSEKEVVSPGEVGTARERTAGPVIIRRRAAFPSTIRGM